MNVRKVINSEATPKSLDTLLKTIALNSMSKCTGDDEIS